MNKIILFLCIFIFIGGCSEVNQDINSTSTSYKEISKFLDQIIIENLDKKAKHEFLKPFKFIDEDTDATIFTKKRVYLFYEGLPSGGIWSKPGAKNFGGVRVGTFYFDNGPITADIIAHIELEGKRNYFYALIESENLEGWVGRPYVMSDKEGKTFLMPNPITGERIRDVIEVKLDLTLARELLVEKPIMYVPSYKEVPWQHCICNFPEEIQSEGYRLYIEALQDGKQKVDALVSEYMSTVRY